MKLLMFFILSLLILSKMDAAQLLEKADNFRSPKGGFEAIVNVTSKNEPSQFQVFIEGNEKSLIVTKSPPKDFGRNMLMLDRDMWMFLPSVNRPIRIALKQKLSGQVAQGDISRMKWVGDYDVQLKSEIPEEKNGTKALKLELKAKKDNLTYDQIHLWIDAKDSRPLFADFLTPQGKILKQARYEDYGPLGGATRPRKIILQDALVQNEQSTIHIIEMNQKKFPQGFFSQSNLAKPKSP